MKDGMRHTPAKRAGAACTRESGFTLMEMLIVVAVIAILIAIAIPTYKNMLRRAERGVAESNVATLLHIIQLNKLSLGYSDDFLDGYTSVSRLMNAKYAEFDKAVFEGVGDPGKTRYVISMQTASGKLYIWTRYYPDPNDTSVYYFFEGGALQGRYPD